MRLSNNNLNIEWPSLGIKVWNARNLNVCDKKYYSPSNIQGIWCNIHLCHQNGISLYEEYTKSETVHLSNPQWNSEIWPFKSTRITEKSKATIFLDFDNIRCDIWGKISDNEDSKFLLGQAVIKIGDKDIFSLDRVWFPIIPKIMRNKKKKATPPGEIQLSLTFKINVLSEKSKIKKRKEKGKIQEVEVIPSVMPQDWTPFSDDTDLTDQFRRPDKSCSVSMVVSQVKKGSITTPHVFYIKSTRLNTYIKITVREKLARWVPDESVMQCVGCQAEFTFLNRRHHCRLCGQIFCTGCSDMKIDIPGFLSPVRVCKQCFNPKKTSFRVKSSRKSYPKAKGCALWVPDMQRENCFMCKKTFGILLPRHHCRACGEIFCSLCSPHIIMLSTYKTPQRVCKTCYCRSHKTSVKILTAKTKNIKTCSLNTSM